MPDNLQNPDYLVPKSNKERYGLDSLENAWTNAQLMQMNTQEREKQKEENFRKILENYYHFVECTCEIGINNEPKNILYGYNTFTAYWDKSTNIKNLIRKESNNQKITELKEELEMLKHLFFHDLIDHLDNGQNQMTAISDATIPIATNKLSFYENIEKLKKRVIGDLTFCINDSFIFDDKNLVNIARIEIINLLPQRKSEKLMINLNQIANISKEFEDGVEKYIFIKKEIK